MGKREDADMKKRIWSLLLALALVCSLLPGAALAAGETPAPPADGTVHTTTGGFEFIFKSGGWTVKSYTGSSSTVTVPKQVEGYDVTAIGDHAFSANKNITTVSLPKGVVSIGAGAFNECPKLAKVTIPAGGLTSIGDTAFFKCGLLSSIALPYGLTSIGASAFSECAKLTAVTLPDTLTSIGTDAFFGCGLTTIAVPGSVTTIGDTVFQNCGNLTTVNLGGGLKSIGDKMFLGCAKLTKLVIPDSVTSIGEAAFKNCGLTVAIVPEQVKSLGAQAFFGCKNLKTLCIPGTIATLPQDAITGCTSLTTIHYTGAGDLGGLPPAADGAAGIAVHSSTASSERKKIPSCSEEGTMEASVVCKAVGCKETLPVELRPVAKKPHTSVEFPQTPPDCVTAGKTAWTGCQVCKLEIISPETIEPLGHKPKTTDTVETKDPTCSEPGYKITSQECERCGKTLQSSREDFEATGNHVKAAQPKETIVSPATCGEPGEKLLQDVCETCGISMGDPQTVEISATGNHTWGDTPVSKVTTEPTCTTKGEKQTGTQCTVCETMKPGTVTTEDIDMLPHQPDETKEITITSTATCEAAGKKTTAATCKECGNDYTLEEDEAALGHDWKTLTDPVVTKPATCTDPGQQTSGVRVCQRENCPSKGTDGKPYQDPASGTAETIPALGHNRKETVEDEAASKAPTCTEAGVKVIKATVCTRCSAAIPEERTELPATDHTKGADTVEKVIKEATCTEPGLSEVGFTCTVCGEPVDSVTTAVPAKGHTYGEWTVIKEATATVPGSRERTCSVCQNKETEEIPATGSSKPEDPDDEREYDIDLIRTSNGSVTLPTHAAAGETVVIRVYPYSGYELDWIEVTRWNGREIRLYSSSDTRYTFTMPSADVEVRAYFTRISDSYHSSSSGTWRPSTSTSTSTPSPGPQTVIQPAPQASGYTAGFSDVPAGHWASGEIGWASQNGYMSGVGGGRFNPSGSISHRQLWMVLARFMGVYPSDMEAARIWAVENGFAVGTNPVSPVTRQQLVVALYRTARLSGSLNGNTASLAKYEDSRLVSASARNAMSWAVANGIISGNANACLNPNGTVTRDQFAVILFRFSQRR